LDERAGAEDIVFTHSVHLEVDPEVRVLDAVVVHEASCLHETFFVCKQNQVYA